VIVIVAHQIFVCDAPATRADARQKFFSQERPGTGVRGSESIKNERIGVE